MADLPKPVSVASSQKPVSVATPAPGKIDAAVEAQAAAPAKPAEATEKKERKSRNSELSGKKIFLVEAKIREKMPEGRKELNPKREGTKGYKAFSLYKNGMTVAEFVKAADEVKDAENQPIGGLADVRWDKEHGFIELRDGDAPAVVTPAAETKPAEQVKPAEPAKTEAPKA